MVKFSPITQRGTPFDRFEFTTSLDKLPELSMFDKENCISIGSQPLMVQLPDSLYNTRLSRSHEVRPGITG